MWLVRVTSIEIPVSQAMNEERKIQPDKPPYLQVINYNGTESNFMLPNNAVRVRLSCCGVGDDSDYYGELNVKTWHLRIWSAFDDTFKLKVDLSALIARSNTHHRVR